MGLPVSDVPLPGLVPARIESSGGRPVICRDVVTRAALRWPASAAETTSNWKAPRTSKSGRLARSDRWTGAARLGGAWRRTRRPGSRSGCSPRSTEPAAALKAVLDVQELRGSAGVPRSGRWGSGSRWPTASASRCTRPVVQRTGLPSEDMAMPAQVRISRFAGRRWRNAVAKHLCAIRRGSWIRTPLVPTVLFQRR
jgi:hypothetical protein